MKKSFIKMYSVLALIIVIFDRITKALALQLTDQKIINQFLMFDLSFNRGLNWGLFNSGDNTVFFVLNVLVASVICAFAAYTYHVWKKNQLIFGHVCILSGAISNYFDRIYYSGVIDFIVVSYRTWSWPAFNIADSAIVIGVLILIYEEIKK